MKIKAILNGRCQNCGKESKQAFCNRQCYLEYVRKDRVDPKQAARGREKKLRDSLTDAMVRKSIYIQSQGKIKYNQMTPDMIIGKRASILAHRQRKEGALAKPVQEPQYCEICGQKTTRRNKKTCSVECRKEKARRDNFAMNKGKKELKARNCKECGKEFIPEYGNKRRDFHSEKCLRKFGMKGNHKNRDRARHFGVAYEYINVTKVFDRDGWHCQICGKKTPKKNRGTCYPNAPELDHRTPMSRGGGHLYSNVQCACRSCNGKKSNHNSFGQLPLFEIRRAA